MRRRFSARVYFVGNTMYQTLVISPKDKVSSPDNFLLGLSSLFPRTQ